MILCCTFLLSFVNVKYIFIYSEEDSGSQTTPIEDDDSEESVRKSFVFICPVLYVLFNNIFCVPTCLRNLLSF